MKPETYDTHTNNTAYCKQGVADANGDELEHAGEPEDGDQDEEHSTPVPGYSADLYGGCMSPLTLCSPGFVCIRLQGGWSLASIQFCSRGLLGLGRRGK